MPRFADGLRAPTFAAIVVAALGFSGCAVFQSNMPLGLKILAGIYFGSQNLVCAIPGLCEADIIPGASVEPFDTELLEGIPVAIDVDPQGRVFVAEAGRYDRGAEDNRSSAYWLLDDLAAKTVEDRRAYIEKWAERGKRPVSHFTEASDRVIRYADRDGDGIADERKELAAFSDALTGLGAGVLVDGDAVYFTEIPRLWRLEDADDDGHAETREALSHGYGVKTSLAGHDLHGLAWGPDGRIYFSIGDRGYHVETAEGATLEPTITPGRGAVFRMKPDGSELEVFATGLRNPQELAFDDYGNLFTGDNNGDGGDSARLVYVVEGGDSGWIMPYQSQDAPYIRGPWNAERLWELSHPNQPAWVIPPIAHMASGPAGLAHYPGLGLPDRYQNHFFLCDYAYSRLTSSIISFGVERAGAGFAVTDQHDFVGNFLATDLTFSADGRLFISRYDQFGGSMSLHVLAHEESRQDPRVAEAAELLRTGLGGLETPVLVGHLGHRNQRVRREAQRALVARSATDALLAVATDPAAARLARIHALWGLGELGATAFDAPQWRGWNWLADEDHEVRAQAARVIGAAKARSNSASLRAALLDGDDRVRYFALQSLGKTGDSGDLPAARTLVRDNADRDVFLRHAAVMAFTRLADASAVEAWASDEARAVRMVALLGLRRRGDGSIARFLSDEDPALVVEAARAINDRPIADALPDLAALAGTELPFRDDDTQTSGALHRRVISAALRVGTPEAAAALAAHAADDRNPVAMRRLALDALRDFTAPGPREPVLGAYRPLPVRERGVVDLALERWLPKMLDGDLESEAMEVALHYDHVPIDDSGLISRVTDETASPDIRVASLEALDRRSSPEATPAIEAALTSTSWPLRAAARDVLARRAPQRALDEIGRVPADAPIGERQAAVETLGRLPDGLGMAPLAPLIDELIRGELEPALELEVIDAAHRAAPREIRARMDAFLTRRAERGPVDAYRFALAGGDPKAGERVFRGDGDCVRCHRAAGHGGDAGPPLEGIAARHDVSHLLESVVAPGARVAEGFGPTSAMPPIGVELPHRDLRDLVAYLATLRDGAPPPP